MIQVLKVKTAEEAPYAEPSSNIREAGAALHTSEEGGE